MWRGPLLLALLVVAAGVLRRWRGGSSLSSADGESLVLSQADVGREYTQFDQGAQRRADLSRRATTPTASDARAAGSRASAGRAPAPTDGPLVISSLADLFASEDGARKDFELYEQWLSEFETTGGGGKLSSAGLGDESQAITYRQGLPPNDVTYFVIAWRDGEVTASLNVNGFRLTREQALGLARTQQERIRAAR